MSDDWLLGCLAGSLGALLVVTLTGGYTTSTALHVGFHRVGLV